nr:hypothetical protein [Tanacetum cinerariifolium]
FKLAFTFDTDLISDELALVSTTLALRQLDLTFLGWSSNLVSLAFLSDHRILLFLVLSFDFDSLALEAKATPVEESTGVSDSMFSEVVVATDGFADFVICGVLLICWFWFFGVTATGFVPSLVILW